MSTMPLSEYETGAPRGGGRRRLTEAEVIRIRKMMGITHLLTPTEEKEQSDDAAAGVPLLGIPIVRGEHPAR